jgi:UDP-2-acetamido-3-amino-2,3-dideoxy-glucuronate N-acetyltransferase
MMRKPIHVGPHHAVRGNVAGNKRKSTTASKHDGRVYFHHPTAIIEEGVAVGRGTRIWAFAHILAGAKLGVDCNVCDHTFIEGDVLIGDRVTVKCGVYLWDGLVLEDDVFLGPAAVFTNDLRPRSKQRPNKYLKTRVRKGASIGANATILPRLTIGKWAMIGAGAVVTKDVPDFALVLGNPARFVSWICSCGVKLQMNVKNVVECSCGKRYRLGRNNKLRPIFE